jgi:hypothetical protein
MDAASAAASFNGTGLRIAFAIGPSSQRRALQQKREPPPLAFSKL